MVVYFRFDVLVCHKSLHLWSSLAVPVRSILGLNNSHFCDKLQHDFLMARTARYTQDVRDKRGMNEASDKEATSMAGLTNEVRLRHNHNNPWEIYLFRINQEDCYNQTTCVRALRACEVSNLN